MKKIVSAGGVVTRVINEKVHIVLTVSVLRNRPGWFLPKGHVEKGETLEQTAEREIKEETGLGGLKLIKKIGTSQRKSYQGDEWKTIHYFLFETDDQRELQEMEDEKERLIPKWHSLDNLPEFFWPEQKEIVQKYINEFFKKN